MRDIFYQLCCDRQIHIGFPPANNYLYYATQLFLCEAQIAAMSSDERIPVQFSTGECTLNKISHKQQINKFWNKINKLTSGKLEILCISRSIAALLLVKGCRNQIRKIQRKLDNHRKWTREYYKDTKFRGNEIILAI